MDIREAWEMQNVLMNEARDEPRLWRPAFPIATFERIIDGSHRLFGNLVQLATTRTAVTSVSDTWMFSQILMNRALFWGWKEGSQLSEHLIAPLRQHLEEVHSQVQRCLLFKPCSL